MGTNLLSSIAICVSIASFVVSLVSLIRLFYLDHVAKISRVSGVIMWGAGSDYRPIVIIQNTGSTVALIDHIDVTYNKRKVFSVSFLNNRSVSEYAVISAGEIKRVPITMGEFKVEQNNGKKALRVSIVLMSGKKTTTKQYFTPEELEGLVFCNELFKKSI